MFPTGSQHAPLEADLLALSELSPPSPVLSPTGLDASWSWSDIQIELACSFDGEAVQDSSDGIGQNPGLGILTSTSISTVATAGTFGPTFKRHKLPGAFNSSDSQHSINSGLSTLDGDVMITSRSGSSEDASLSTPVSSLSRSLNRPATSRLSATLSDRIYAAASDQTTLLLSRSNSLTLPPSILSRSHSKENTIYSKSIPKSRMFSNITNVSTSGSCNGSISLSPSDSCPMSVRPKPRQEAFFTSVSNYAPVDVHARRLAVAAALAALEKKCHSEPSTPKCAVPMPRNDLPSNFSAATVEIMIDQEGFRGVLARFKYSGYTVARHAIDGDGSGVTYFRPVKRQAFYFHYAALEPLPVLRRITVNGEESRDYVSRQASLCLKTNGVYFVKGSETLSFPVPGESTPMSVLQWKFEYMVDDRRSDVSGKFLAHGEKLLTPLSFSCSPLLLHPLQGKRVRLMHVMKKRVVSKLIAEKMEPPSFSPTIKPEVKQARRGPPSPVPPYAAIQKRGFRWHKRSATLWIPGEGFMATRPSMNLDAAHETQPSANRRRRASSAGEHSRPENPLPPQARHLPHGDSPVCRYIIPRSLLATVTIAEGTPVKHSLALSEPSSNIEETFYPLSPSPLRPRQPSRTECRYQIMR